MSSTNDTTPPTQRRRRRPLSPAALREVVNLSTLTAADASREDVAAMCDQIALWARYMMDINPADAARFFRACREAWRDNRGNLYAEDMPATDERDRQTILFNVALCSSLTAVFGRTRKTCRPLAITSTRTERAACLLKMQSQIAQMSARLERERHTDEPVQFERIKLVSNYAN